MMTEFLLVLVTGFFAVVSASVHTSEIFASLASGLSPLRFENVNVKIALPLTVSGVIGGVFSAYFLSSLSGDFG